MNRTQSGYMNKLDDIAESYYSAEVPDRFIETICQEYSLDWIAKKIEGKSHLLELGLGDGVVNEFLAQRRCKVDVVEGSKKIIAAARKKNSDIRIHHSLFETFEATDYRYDCVLALHVVEHVDEPAALLEKMKSWLTPSGSVLIIVPNKNSLHRQLAVEMGLQEELDDLSPRDIAVGHQRVYCHDTLRAEVLGAGYKVLDETGFFLKTLPNGMMLEFSEELIWAMNKISPMVPMRYLANIGMELCPI